MKYTNLHNLPATLFRALVTDTYRGDPETWSVTKLISPPRIVQLTKRHYKEIVKDATDFLFSLLGSAVHVVCELSAGKNDIAEVRLRMKLDGGIVSGMTDLYNPIEQEIVFLDEDGEALEDIQQGASKFDFRDKPGGAIGHIMDNKITGTYSFLLEGKDYAVVDKNGMISEAGPWTAQINLNAMLHRNAGFEVNRGSIVAILRDWNRRKAQQDRNYPQRAFYVLDIPLWTQEQCVDYAQRRLDFHLSQIKKGDTKLELCTEVERWYRGESFAVIKDGNKKATRVGANEKEAEKLKLELIDAHNKGEERKVEERKVAMVVKPTLKEYKAKPSPTYNIVHRPGENIRCTDYCDCAFACDFAKTLTQTDHDDE